MPYRNKIQCACAVQLLYHADNFGVTWFVSGQEHNHDEILENVKTIGLNKATKEFIDKLLALRITTAKPFQDLLAKEALKNPAIKIPKDSRQLNNYLAGLRRKGNKSLILRITNFKQLPLNKILFLRM